MIQVALCGMHTELPSRTLAQPSMTQSYAAAEACYDCMITVRVAPTKPVYTLAAWWTVHISTASHARPSLKATGSE
jgi:hypothetical protein